MGSNPVESPEFFRFMRQLLKLSSKCEHKFLNHDQLPCGRHKFKTLAERLHRIHNSRASENIDQSPGLVSGIVARIVDLPHITESFRPTFDTLTNFCSTKDDLQC